MEKEIWMSDKKIYDTIIPSGVRYSSKLSASAKILYSEIAFICKRDGYCIMRNSYFAKLFGTYEVTVSRWVQSLKKHKFIQCEIRHKFIRFIFLQDADEKHINGMIKKLLGAKQKCLDNTTYYKQEHFNDTLATDDTVVDDGDFDIETKEWTDKDGVRRGRDSIDYG